MLHLDESDLPKSELLKNLELARIDFLYGEGGKKPVQDTKALARKYDLTTIQITRYAPAWLAELRANARTASRTYGRASDPETVDSCDRDVAFMREQLDQLSDKLSSPGITPEHADMLWKLYLKLQKRWSELAGVEGALKAVSLAQTTVMRQEVLLQYQKEQEKPEERNGDDARPVSDKVFDITPEENKPNEFN